MAEDRDGDGHGWDLGTGRKGLVGGDAQVSCLPGPQGPFPEQRDTRDRCRPGCRERELGVGGEAGGRGGRVKEGRVWVFVGPGVCGPPGVCRAPAQGEKGRVSPSTAGRVLRS